MTEILTIKLPVPVPSIKTISRWKVFLSLFNPHTHFTTCEELRYQLVRETERIAGSYRTFASRSFKGNVNHEI
jgi:hypothetical protein